MPCGGNKPAKNGLFMVNNIIQSLWIGNQLSNNEILCMKSYLYHGHEFHLYAYEQIANIPDGVQQMDANDIIPATSLFKDSAYTYASFADWFRLKLLYARGGWWVDLDTICLQPFNISAPCCFSSEREFRTNNTAINNTYMKFPAGAPYLETLIGQVEEKIGSDATVVWGEAGVYLLRKIFPDNPGLQQYIQPPEVFCPIDYFDLSGLICKSDYTPQPQTLAIHLWNEIWRRGNLDKNAIYHPESIYERLKEKYLE